MNRSKYVELPTGTRVIQENRNGWGAKNGATLGYNYTDPKYRIAQLCLPPAVWGLNCCNVHLAAVCVLAVISGAWC